MSFLDSALDMTPLSGITYPVHSPVHFSPHFSASSSSETRTLGSYDTPQNLSIRPPTFNDAPSIRGEIMNDHTFDDDIDADSGDVHEGPLFMSTPKRQIWQRVIDDNECNSDTYAKNYDGENDYDDDDDNGPFFTSTPKHKVWYREATAGGGGADDDSDGSDTDDDPDDDNNHRGGLDDGDADDTSRQSVQSYYIGDQDEYSQFSCTDSLDLFLMNQSNLVFNDQDSGLMRETHDDFKIFVPENNHTPKAHGENDDDEEEDEHTENDIEEAVDIGIRGPEGGEEDEPKQSQVGHGRRNYTIRKLRSKYIQKYQSERESWEVQLHLNRMNYGADSFHQALVNTFNEILDRVSGGMQDNDRIRFVFNHPALNKSHQSSPLAQG